MAGIGFQLKKMFNEHGFLANVRAYSYSAIVTVGPLALCILLMTVAQQLLISVDTPHVERELFMAATQYALIFSQIITGGFNLIVSRYVADQLFIKKYENILASMYGVIAICVSIGAIVALLFFSFSPLDLTFKIVSYILFVELIIIWIQCMYVSALKDYMKIVKSFLVGVCLSGLAVFICIKFFHIYSAVAMMICLDVGFFFMLIKFTQYIREFFKVNNFKYFLFLSYMRKYPLLFICGFLYTLGLYGHSLIVWQGKHQHIVADTFVIAPFYDVPVFFAYLSVLPAMVLFVVSVETNFYTAYQIYYNRILNSFPLKDILSAKKDMFKVLSLELSFIAEIQLFVAVCSIALGLKFLPLLGLTYEQIQIFIIFILGFLFFIIMYTVVLLLLYYDDQKGASWTTMIYTIGSILVTYIFLHNGNYGFSVFIAAFISLVFGLWKLTSFLNKIDYYTFCSQPLLPKKEMKPY
ncbi:exopolysaccharide Pel transporter PelG [Cytobacillus massiliigabonensis]|uniref:exopolysaccharide Pel transporter PelG n=1 Tax=Cytobacillus massiliigabonensis TaxID=1871011 RepID=UPI000C81900B|nr:exopolysaccharide Pel transporter PelG [Cytobacillus massiliigabonensis]